MTEPNEADEQMRLPKAETATLDIRKLEDYCLNPFHPIGRSKARVFQSALGLLRSDADWLRQEILRLLPNADADELDSDAYGRRYRADLVVTRHDLQAVVRTIWIMTSHDNPRFITCWVL